jgi:hypothetical protein
MTQPSIDFGYPTEAHGKIPSFKDIEEEAEFWDTHDLTDFLEESEPVEATISGKLSEQIAERKEHARRLASEGPPKEMTSDNV